MSVKKLWHFDAVSAYELDKYSTLIHDHNVISNQLKRYEIDPKEEDKDVMVDDNGNIKYSYSGWLAKKGRDYYILAKDDIDRLPIRVNQEASQEVILKDGKHVTILHSANSFKIVPRAIWTPKQLLNNLCPFLHEDMEDYELYKIMILTSWISRISVRFCTKSEFGKDSVNASVSPLLQDFKIAEDLTTFPAILREMTQNGVLIFNEACGNIKADVKTQMSKLIFKVADGKNSFSNPSRASAAHGTKDMYRTDNLSIIAIYNTLQQYSDEKLFFDYQFANSTAINSRMLPLCASGKLIEDFTDKNTDYTAMVKEDYSQEFYRSFLMTITWMKTTRKQYKQQWNWKVPLLKKGGTRHSQSFYEIALTCDQMSESQEEMDRYLNRLRSWNDNYYRMLNGETVLEVGQTTTTTVPFNVADSNPTKFPSPRETFSASATEASAVQRSLETNGSSFPFTGNSKQVIKKEGSVPLVLSMENIENEKITLRDL